MEAGKPIRVLLAEDHRLVREGISLLLQNCPDIEIVAQANDGSEALRQVDEHRPDVALLDVRMPGLSGLEAAERIACDYPETSVIMLSIYVEEEYVLRAMRVGARGYLLKDATPEELVRAILAVARGEVYLSQAVANHVAGDYVRQMFHRTADQVPVEPVAPEPLTPRQREILELIGKGHGTREIAQILCVSPKTVETHRLQVMERLDIHDVAGLVRYAIQHKLVSLDDSEV